MSALSERKLISRIDQLEGHRHLEGVIRVYDLIEDMQRYEEFGVKIDPATVALMKSIVEKGLVKKDLFHFIQLLPTRWMRLDVLKLMLETDRDISKLLVARFLSEKVEEAVRDALDPQREDISLLKLLVCFDNMVVDGDLSDLSFLSALENKTEDEKNTYEKWSGLPLSERRKRGLTLHEYVQLTHETIQHVSQEPEYTGKQVYVAFSLRRDRDRRKLIDSSTRESDTNTIQEFFARGWIHEADLSGPETNPDYPTSDYIPFFRKLQEKEVPTSLHFLELHNSMRALANKNRDSVRELSHLPDTLAHAIRLGDQFEKNEALLEEVIENEVMIMFNGRSNEWTGSIGPGIHFHRLMINLLTKRGGRANIERVLLAMCADDPCIYSLVRQMALREEIEENRKAIKKMGRRNSQIMSADTAFEHFTQHAQRIATLLPQRVSDRLEKIRVLRPNLFIDTQETEASSPSLFQQIQGFRQISLHA